MSVMSPTLGTQCKRDRPGLSSPRACRQGLQESGNLEQLLSEASFPPDLRGAGQLRGLKSPASVHHVRWGFEKENKPLSEKADYPPSSL